MFFAQDFIKQDNGQIPSIDGGRLERFILGNPQQDSNYTNDHLNLFLIFLEIALSDPNDVFEKDRKNHL